MSTAVVTLATAGGTEKTRLKIWLKTSVHETFYNQRRRKKEKKKSITSVFWSKKMQTLLFLPACFNVIVNGVWSNCKDAQKITILMQDHGQFPLHIHIFRSVATGSFPSSWHHGAVSEFPQHDSEQGVGQVFRKVTAGCNFHRTFKSMRSF